jgi:nicotinamidase-related amidase
MNTYSRTAALLLIDMQKESRYGIEGVDEVVATAERVVGACRTAGVVVAYTRHVNRPDGIGVSAGEVFDSEGLPVYYRAGTEAITIHDAIEPQPHDVVIDKHRWSGFHGTSLDLVLRNLRVRELFIGGFTTDCCVLSSVYDAYARDYQVSLVPDMCAATNQGSHQAAVLMMANWVYGIEILSASDVVKKVAGEPHRSWRATEPDQKQFRPESLQDAYASLF